MAHEDSLIADRVMNTVESIENDVTGDMEELLDPLEVKVEAGLDGSISEIIAVVTTGGPHIEVALYSGRVDGYWGGDEHSALIMDEQAERQLEQVAERYELHWNENVLA